MDGWVVWPRGHALLHEGEDVLVVPKVQRALRHLEVAALNALGQLVEDHLDDEPTRG